MPNNPISASGLKTAGFTAIELMVTIAVAAILLAIAVPSFTQLIANTRETSATDSLVNALNYARNTALRSGQPVTVCPTAASASTTCSVSWNTGWGVVSTDTHNQPVLLSNGNPGTSGITVSASGGATPLIFTPRGLVTGLPAAGTNLFTVCDYRGTTKAQAVLVNAGGFVQTSQTPGLDPNGAALNCP